MKSIPLAKFRHARRKIIASLSGLKSIMVVQTARRIAYYLVLPSVGEADARCILLEKHNPRTAGCTYWKEVEGRIIADETARCAV